MGEGEVSPAPPATAGVPRVIGVSRSQRHTFSKEPQPSIHLAAGLGIEGDAHRGAAIQHRHGKRSNPGMPNLRQVHLLQSELFPELSARGMQIGPGDMGENITTADIDLLTLPTGTRLHLGASAIVEVTGLRDPCVLMDRFCPGLMAATLDRDISQGLVRKAGIMSIVVASGTVYGGDLICVALPAEPHQALKPV